MDKKIEKKIKREIFKNKGFSLIEILVSISLVSLILGGIVFFGARTIQAHAKSQAMQNSLDNARFFIEKMNKQIRTSSGLDPSSGGFGSEANKKREIFFIDNATGRRVCYKFDQDKKALKYAENSGTGSGCGMFSEEDFHTLAGEANEPAVEGFFFTKTTDESGEKRGFVQVVLTIKYREGGAVSEKDQITIQSGVSLRDYFD